MMRLKAALYQHKCRVSDYSRELTAEDLQFVAYYTGQSDDILHEHVLKVWRKAKTTLWVYKCVQEFAFLIPRIIRHPHYKVVQTAQLQQPNSTKLLHLDTGCCFGQDTRQLLADGWKQHQLIATDLVSDYWYSCT